MEKDDIFLIELNNNENKVYYFKKWKTPYSLSFCLLLEVSVKINFTGLIAVVDLSSQVQNHFLILERASML
jgi:hypothetical protein